MKSFTDTDEILRFAINSEQESVDFNTRLSVQSNNQEMKAIFRQYAREEMGHKARLASIRETGLLVISREKIQDLKMADYLVDVFPNADMKYDEALILAIKKEKAAFQLYLDLAEKAADDSVKEIFLTLANEESKHKLRFETEYDEFVLREN